MPQGNPRLANAQSPYLAEAADQPVDWYPWGDEAFQRAREEGKPVLVDAGAVWCHWCHVMDHESYDDPETAELINDRFVAVKLDRDERPDVDKRLQQAVGAITGRGGWPLTAFLTPEQEVFYGGTYFPREAQGGMPSFRQVLDQVASLYENEPERARDQANKIQDALQDAAPTPGSIEAKRVLAAVDQALGAYDPANGGFGSRPKFPHPSTVDLLSWFARTHEGERSRAAGRAAMHTLEAMGEGGVFDQLAGGFHRYSVDAQWHTPHFEKMLYDNGPLLSSYARAAAQARRAGRDEQADALERTAAGIWRFLDDVLAHPGGGFGGSQDADRRPDHADGPLDRHDLDDGGYFTWSLEEAQAVLDGPELKVARLHYGIQERGDVREAPDQNVLRIQAHPEEIAAGMDRSVDEIRQLIERVREKLYAARREREAPFVDPTVYADWNGLAIPGLLLYAHLLDAPAARRAALEALDRLLDEALDPDEGFLHALSEDGARVQGLVDDQVQMLTALVEAFNATGEADYLEAARDVANLLVERFVREDGRLRFNAREDEAAPEGDQPTASPAAQAALQLPRVARLTGEDRFAETADEVLEAIAGRSQALGGVHGGTLHQAMLARFHEPAHVVIVGAGQEGERQGRGDPANDLRRAVLSVPAFHQTILQVDDPDAPGVPPEAREAARSFEDETVAVVCRGNRCQVARTPSEVQEALWTP